jgi:hypothetical protein
MIAKSIPQLDNVLLVSPLNKSVHFLKKHLEERAKLIYTPSSLDVFPSASGELKAMVLEMHKLGAEPNQCVLLVEYENRRVVLDTMSTWQNWGGVALIMVDGLDKTLRYIEEELLDGNIPLEMNWLWQTK